jgi:sec-independent protein translocase protein TatB
MATLCRHFYCFISAVTIPSSTTGTLSLFVEGVNMFDLGWAELAFLAVLALVVIGPQDLPKLAHTIGMLWGKLQRFYRDSMMGIRKLETEIDLASQPDQRNQPSYYDLLPEHVRQALEQAEPSRDPEQNQRTQQLYQEAMADIAAKQNPTGDEQLSQAKAP